ncbi:VgrG-related protein [Streptomyces bambusae]|uniref:VgrG-related protein n=1 Tax=Streptomyces bambusae TaxID=1550616 RepID=UPI001CFD04F0|nr:VgrG-related protein [Streptomyces bambusae]MCB5164596.1 VgrG-related protein [Streptomyces bambusae]
MKLKPSAIASATTPPVSRPGPARADVRIGATLPTEVPGRLEQMIVRVVVDTHLHLPGMFEITFLDNSGWAAEQLDVGHKVEIWATGGSAPLIHGKITTLEAVCEELVTYVVARGYDLSHVLQRSRRTRTFVNTKDSDIAQQIAEAARLNIGTIDETQYVHGHLAQVAQTDWDFLQARARANGFEMGMTGKEFHFRRAAAGAAGAGPKGAKGPKGVGKPAALPDTAAEPTLTFRDNLLSFRPRLVAPEMLPDQVEVRTWDEENTEVVVATAPVRPVTPDAGAATAPSAPALPAGKFKMGGLLAGDTHVVVNHPVGAGADIAVAAESLAAGTAERIGATSAQAEGFAFGDSAIQAGGTVQVEGVPGPFCGTWTVTHARHTFSDDDGGHFTRFTVSGADTGLPTGPAGGPAADADRRAGLMCGIVTNVADPTGRNRIKVRLDLLSPDYETDWVRVVQPGGNRGAVIFVPEVGDEVLVAFEWDDVNRPVVLGGMRNGASTLTLGGAAVERKGDRGDVMRRGLVSSSGSRLAFVEVPPNRSPLREQSAIVLATAQGDLGLTIDQTTGQVLLTCKPQTGKTRGKGDLTISTDGTGAITIDAGKQGVVNVTGSDISVRATKRLELASNGDLEIKGTKVKVTGTTIDLN